MDQFPEKRPSNNRDEPSKCQQSKDPQSQLDELELKSARTLATVATVAGPVSFIIGGVALSTVALVCAIISWVKIRRLLEHVDQSQRAYVRALRQTALIAMAIGAVALVLNGISVAVMMPVLIEAMQTGDFSSILGNAAANIPNSAGSSGSGGNAWG